MKVLVFGSHGRAGMVLARRVAAMGHEVLAPTSRECDFRKEGGVLDVVRRSCADCVFNCAAVSSLERCAQDMETCKRVNVKAPIEMAIGCRDIAARFVHMSTDYVYDGECEGLRSESEPPHPLSEYARSKLESETCVMAICPSAVVARVSWLCGNPVRPGFVESVVRKTLSGEQISAICDKTSKPTDVRDLAAAMMHIAASPLTGAVNVCSTGTPVSWLWLAETAARATVSMVPGTPMPKIEAQRLDDVPFFREPRPRHTAMDNSLLAESGFSMPSCEATVLAAVKAVFDSCNSSTT